MTQKSPIPATLNNEGATQMAMASMAFRAEYSPELVTFDLFVYLYIDIFNDESKGTEILQSSRQSHPW